MIGRRIALDFSGLDPAYWSAGEERAKMPIDNLSTAAWDGAHLWVASDETGTVERLSRDGAGFGNAKSYPLSDYFSELPADKEYDIEALAFDAAWNALWLCSSHARIRKRAEIANPADLLFDTDFELKQRRCVLGLLPLGTGAPRKRGARMLPRGGRKGSLRAALAAIGGALEAALDVPAKENGLDVEGLAIHDRRLFVGLRGPVVGGHGVVVSALVEAGDDLALARPPNVFLLPLNGLGVRDLVVCGDGMLVLAGPTFEADGPFRLHVWPVSPLAEEPYVTVHEGLACVADLTGPLAGRNNRSHERPERAEALAVVDGHLLVLHDRPAKSRRPKPWILEGDMIPLRDLRL